MFRRHRELFSESKHSLTIKRGLPRRGSIHDVKQRKDRQDTRTKETEIKNKLHEEQPYKRPYTELYKKRPYKKNNKKDRLARLAMPFEALYSVWMSIELARHRRSEINDWSELSIKRCPGTHR